MFKVTIDKYACYSYDYFSVPIKNDYLNYGRYFYAKIK
jgi:hypothetical protein